MSESGIKSSPPGLKFVLLILDAADAKSRSEVLLPVLHRFIGYTGVRFAMDIADPANAHRVGHLCKQMYPSSLRAATRGFICSLLCGMHGLLFDGSDEALAVRDQLDVYVNFATYDVTSRNKIAICPPEDAGDGCKKVWTYVQHTFPGIAKFNSELDVDDSDNDPVKASPVSWDVGKVNVLLAYASVILEEARARDQLRKIPTGLYSLSAQLTAHLPPSIVDVIRAKGDFSRCGKIVPPCARGLRVLIEPLLADVIYTTYPGGFKKSGDVENPFGSAKGYDKTKRDGRSLRSKMSRIALRKLAVVASGDHGGSGSGDLVDKVLSKMGRKRRAPSPTPVPTSVTPLVDLEGGDKKRPALADSVFGEILQALQQRKARESQGV